MVHFPYLKISSLIGIFLFVALFSVQAEEEDFSADGYNSQRIEQEDKLFVPLDKAEEVWNYLEQTYVKDQEGLKKIDPLFTSYWNLEEFWDTYFDTPSFQVLEQENGVRFRRRVNLTNPEDRKSGRELMQIKLNNISSNPLDRGEIKYDIREIEPGEITTPIDNHPMIGLVKRSHRDGFIQRLKDMGLDPMTMRPVLTVHDYRSRIYILKDQKPFMSVSFDRASANIWWAGTNFIEIEPELNEIAYTDADEETRKYMESILGIIVSDIHAQFPYIERNLTPKYGKSFNALEAQLPFLPLLVKFNLNDVKGMFIVLVPLIIVIISLLYAIRKKFIALKEPLPAPPQDVSVT
jgi:hypothetical protein